VNRWQYALTRILQMIPTLLVIMVLVFAMVRLLPGDPAVAILGDRVTDQAVARVHKELGLDKPLPVQFWYFLERVARGDLGTSINLKVPVTQLIADRMPVTLFLTLYAGVLAALLSVPAAVLSALKRGTWVDNLIRAIFQVGLSLPVFYLSLQLLGFFGARLHWFPVGGIGPTAASDLYYLFLPALSLGFYLAAILMRNLRSSILEVLDAEYVDFARAKGIRPRLVLFKHILRNALISTVTLFGLSVGQLMGGAVITETVFAIPGVGRLMVDAIFGRDYAVVQGLTLAFAVVIMVVFLLTDLAYSTLDPRTKVA
jgi:peptide/nickel transport system permease protein